MRGGRGRREDRERGRGGGTQSECSNSERGKVTRRQPAKGKERQGNEPKHWLVKYQLPGAGDDDEGGQTLNKINIFSASECQIHVYWFDRCAGFRFRSYPLEFFKERSTEVTRQPLKSWQWTRTLNPRPRQSIRTANVNETSGYT